MPRGRKKIHTDLPPRSDPNYMRLYNEKFKGKKHRYYENFKERKLQEDPEYFKKRRDLEKEAQYRAANVKTIAEKRWRKYGIIDMTYEKYLEELEKCGGLCAICKHHMNRPHVDHDHSTGKYRGLLCAACNTGLGIFENYRVDFEKYIQVTS